MQKAFIIPKVQAAFVGSTISVKCYSYTKPKWRKSFGHTKFTIRKSFLQCFRTKIYVHELYIYKAGPQHNSEYKCRGTQRNGLTFEENTLVYVGSRFLYTHAVIT